MEQAAWVGGGNKGVGRYLRRPIVMQQNDGDTQAASFGHEFLLLVLGYSVANHNGVKGLLGQKPKGLIPIERGDGGNPGRLQLRQRPVQQRTLTADR